MGDKIRNYRNDVLIDFAIKGENFTLNVPHKGKWQSVITFLRKRGFVITENQSYKEHYSCISKYHKIGRKGDVACLLEICPQQIHVKFGNIQNLWTGIVQDFWQKGDSFDRYTPISYLEEQAVKLEIKRLTDHCMSKWGFRFEPEERTLSAIERILYKEARNKHIHGGPTSLEELAEYVKKAHHDSYEGQYNLLDKNKKPIYCGETKWFYDEYRTKRLIRGTVYHNINNMWWVILPCGTLRNEANFRLFDWSENLPKREKLSKDEEFELMSKLHKKSFDNRDFKRVMAITIHLSNISNQLTKRYV